MAAVVFAAIALAGLLIAGSRHLAVRTASAEAPNQFTIATLRRGHHVCEGPLTSHGAARGVAIWGGAAGGPAITRIEVNDFSTHKTVASGSLASFSREDEWAVRLDRDVPAGRPVQICLVQDLGAFSLSGSASSGARISQTGIPGGQRFSLVLLSAGDRSFLGSLSLAFSRASLWRFSWVGTWTFWLLAVCVAMTFGLAVLAVVSADAEDNPPGPSGPPSPDARSPLDHSEAGEDRPQPVAQ